MNKLMPCVLFVSALLFSVVGVNAQVRPMPAPPILPPPIVPMPAPITAPMLPPPMLPPPILSQPVLSPNVAPPVSAGGPPPDLQFPILILPPMPVINEIRDLMEQRELILDLYDIATDRETNTRIDAWIQRTVRRKPVFISVPKLLLSEPEVVKAIFKLEVKAIKLVKARLTYDVRQLTPFESDSANTKQEKMEVIRQHERELDTLTTKANEEAESGSNWRKVEESRTHSKLQFESSALRQLGIIAATGKWKGQ